MGRKIEVDVEALDRAFEANFGPQKDDLTAKAQAAPADIAGFAGLDLLDEHISGFCNAWPRIKPIVKIALRGISLIYPTQVAMVRAGLDALDQEVISKICNGEDD